MNLSQSITRMKGGRYTAELLADASKLIPQLTSQYKKVETICVQKVDDVAVLTAVAAKLDDIYAKSMEIESWARKLFGGGSSASSGSASKRAKK